ncbi:hypothetical protein D3C76_1611520 [compost metagenome]
MNKEIEHQFVVRLIVKRRVITRLRAYTLTPVDAFVGHNRRYKSCARSREKDFGMVVKTL